MPIKKKKKFTRNYKYILRIPAEKQTGWQEVVMDLDTIDRSLEATRQVVQILKKESV